MPKMNLVCFHCGKEYTSYQRGKNYSFCSIECRRKEGSAVTKGTNAKATAEKSKRFAEMNRTLMLEPKYVEKRRKTLKAKNPTNGYTKHHGRHEHRVIAEKKLGRKLRKNEIVHHKDGNKSNNHPDNLEVMTQSEHIRTHMINGKLKGGDAA